MVRIYWEGSDDSRHRIRWDGAPESSGSEYEVGSEKEFAPKVASINSDRDPSRDPRRNKNTLDL